MSRLAIDHGARTIRGRAIPWNTPALVNHQWVALYRDSLTCPDRVPLVLVHNHSLIVGRVTAYESVEDGLYVTFKVAIGERGDRAIAKAEVGWGLSCNFFMTEHTLHGSTEWCNRGEISEISLVPNPAFP